MKMHRRRISQILRSRERAARRSRLHCVLESLEPRSLLAGDVAVNPTALLDVNHDGNVTPLDALLIINELNLHGPHPTGTTLAANSLQSLTSTGTSSTSATNGNSYDVNQDGLITPLDTLLVMNALNVPGPSIKAELVALNASGTVISTSGSTNTLTVTAGQDFILALRVQDLRTTSDASGKFGVFAAYTDVSYSNPGLVSLGTEVQHYGDYPNNATGVPGAGTIDEAGGFSGATSLDKLNHFVWQIPVHASASGTVTFTPAQADGTGHEFLLFAESGAITDPTQIQFRPLAITINAGTPPVNPTVSIAGTGAGAVGTSVSLPEGALGDTTDFVYRVSLSANPTSTVAVLVRTTGTGTATVDSDYAPLTQTLTFAPGGALTQDITVSVFGDNTLESNETFNLTLVNPVNATLETANASGTIQNDDTPAVSVVDATVSTGTTDTSIVFTINLSSAPTSTQTVVYATQNGTATAPSDFGATTGTATFTAGQTTQTVTITVKGNTAFESSETFNLLLSNPSAGITINDGTGVGTITSNIAPPSFAINGVSSNEGNSGTTNFVFTVTKTGSTEASSTVQFTTSNGTATAGSDYTATSGTLTFAAGETSKTITVVVIGDTVFENSETFSLDLSHETNASIATGTGLGTIQNDDSLPSFSVSAPAATNEGNSATKNFVFTITKTGGTAFDSTVVYQTADGTATNGSDYTPTSGTLTFAPGDTAKTVTVVVNGDTMFENDEQFSLQLLNVSGATISTSSATASILNDDAAPVFNVSGPAPQSEGDSGTTAFVFTISKTGGTALDSTVVYQTADGTATNGSDYVATSGTLTFAPGETEKTVTVLVNGDTTFENNEQFSFNLSALTNATITTGTATGTINNDDSSVFSVSGSTAQNEGDSGTTDFVFTITKTGNPNVESSVVFTTQDGTALDGSDYVGQSGTLTFLAGETSKTITVTVNGDTAFENDESFTFKLSNATNSTISTDTATGTINNDDTRPVISVSGPVSTPEGNSGTSNFVYTITKTGTTNLSSTVVFNAQSVTATAGTDYVSNSGTLTFAPGDTEKTVTVLVNGDTTYENDETFDFKLSGITNATVSTDSVNTTISNDDPLPTINLSGPAPTNEGNSGTTNFVFTVTRSASELSSTVVFTTQDNASAVAGSDYAATSGTLTFASGETTKTITVAVTGDAVYENDETFTMQLSDVTGATLGTSSVSATIKNDDALPSFSVAGPASTAEGNSGTKNFVFTVTKSGATAFDSTVQFATQNGTATAGSDYAAISGTLTFAAGETSKNVTVVVNGDTDVEANENFQLVLSNPTQAALGTATADATILDDDGVRFSIADISKNEGNSGTTDFLFEVTTSVAPSSETKIIFTPQAGTATISGVFPDLPSQTGTITFTAGQTTQTVTIHVNGDTAFETDQTFSVKLTAGTPGVQFDRDTAVGTILNDDNNVAPAVTFQVDPPTSVAEGTSIRTSVTLNKQLDVPVTFTVTPSGTGTNPAVADINFVAAPQSITFEPGDTSKTININTIDNHFYFSTALGVALTLSVNDSALVNMASVTPQTATITSNTAKPVVGIELVNPSVTSAFEGTNTDPNAIGASVVYRVTLTGHHQGNAPVVVVVQTDAATTHTDANDFVSTLVSQTLSFADNAASTSDSVQTQLVTVNIKPDSAVENNETFHLSVTPVTTNSVVTVDPTKGVSADFTILNDDVALLKISGPSATNEGNTGTTNFVFGVLLEGVGIFADQPIAVSWETAEATDIDAALRATADTDFVSASGTLALTSAGTGTATVYSGFITIAVKGDTVPEGNEQFLVKLKNVVSGGPTIGINSTLNQATATINNDDSFQLSVEAVAQDEGTSSGYKPMVFTVTLNNPASFQTTVAYTTALNSTSGATSATAEDFQATSGTLTFAPGVVSQTVTVQVLADSSKEADQTFQLQLSNITTNGTGNTVTFATGKQTAVGTITNDDEAVLQLSASGMVYRDLNNNGKNDGGGELLPGVTFRLSGTTEEGAAVSETTVTSDAVGNFIFANLAPGTYTLSEDQPSSNSHKLTTPGSNATLVTGQTDKLTLKLTSAGSSGNVFAEGGKAGGIVSKRDYSPQSASATNNAVLTSQGLATSTVEAIKFTGVSGTLNLQNSFTTGTAPVLTVFVNDVAVATSTAVGTTATLNYTANAATPFTVVVSPTALASGFVPSSVPATHTFTATQTTDTVAITGTTGSKDVFQFQAGSTQTVLLNGTQIAFNSSVKNVSFAGQDNDDVAMLTGSTGNDTATAKLGSGTLEATGSYKASVSGVKNLMMNGNGGTDTASIEGSASNDHLFASGNLVSVVNDLALSVDLLDFDHYTALNDGSGVDSKNIDAAFTLFDSIDTDWVNET